MANVQVTGSLPLRRRGQVTEAGAPRKEPVRKDRVPAGWAWFAALVGPALTAVCVALEPLPADPNATATIVDTVLGVAMLSTWGIAAFSALRQVAAALTWAAIGSATALVLSISCPASGHHTNIGAWWYTQMVLSGAALAASVVGRSSLRRT